MEQMDACIIASKGDLEYEIQGMLPAFEGRESEQNWNLRDKHITRLRGLLRGNAYKEYPTTFMNGIGSLQSGIVKGVSPKSRVLLTTDDFITNTIMFEIMRISKGSHHCNRPSNRSLRRLLSNDIHQTLRRHKKISTPSNSINSLNNPSKRLLQPKTHNTNLDSNTR